MDERDNPTSPTSFRSMYREHYGLVWGAARRFGVEDHHLDDAVQETFLVAYRRMGSFGGGSAKAWLYGITRRVASNYRRAERRATRRKDAVKRTTQATRSRPAEAVEAWQTLDRFVTALPEQKREIFVLAELEGMTGAEVARTLGLRPSTTYDAIRALRRRYREHVEELPEPRQLRRLAQRERPGATARSWSALVAAMPSGGLATASPASSGLPKWSALSLATKATVAGLGTAAVLAVGSAVGGPRPSERPSATPATTATRTASVSRASVDGAPLDRPAPEPPPVATPTPSPRDEPAAALRSPRPHDAAPAEEPAPPPAPRSLAAENALLRDAAMALAAGDAARALELADRHGTDHARSPMRDVSIALRIESLCALGKRAQARGEARVFLRRRPGSPLAERIESACPEHPPAAP